MRLPNAAPEEGARFDYDHFNNWQVKGGERHFAYYAGGAQWFIAHPSDRGTKPCLCWMTKNALSCRFCAANKCPVNLGYVPLWRAIDWRPLLVIVYQEEREWIDKLQLHDRVQLGREKESGARIWVRRCLDQEPRFSTTLARRMVTQDITPSLLRLWKLADLNAWLNSQSDNALSQPQPAPVKSDGKPFDAMHRAAAERVANKEEPPKGTGEVFDVITERMKNKTRDLKPSKNGKHET